jgi:hypothetical protein
MYIPRLLILLLGVSVSLAPQVSGHERHEGNVYECVVGPETVQRPWKNPFPQPAFHQNGISLTRIVPPLEFRAHDLTMVDARRVSLFDSLFRTPKPISCQVNSGDGRESFH